MNKRRSNKIIGQIVLASTLSGLGVYAQAGDFRLDGNLLTILGPNNFSQAPVIGSNGVVAPVLGVPISNTFGIPSFKFTLLSGATMDGTYSFKVGVVFSDDNSSRRIEAYIGALNLVVSDSGASINGFIPAQNMRLLGRNGAGNIQVDINLTNSATNGPVKINGGTVTFDAENLINRIRASNSVFDAVILEEFNSGGHYTYQIVVDQTSGPETIRFGTGPTFVPFPRIQTTCALSPASQSNQVFTLASGDLADNFPLSYAVQGQFSVAGASGSADPAPAAFTESCSAAVIVVPTPTAPSADALTTNSATPTLTGTATLAAGETLTVTVNGTTYTTGGALTFNANAWTLTIPAGSELPDSSFQVEATVTNSASVAVSGIAELVVDTTAPLAPIINAVTDISTTPVISGSRTDPRAVLGSVETLTVTVNGKAYSAAAGNLIVSGTTWSLRVPASDALPGSLIPITATLTDAAGNSSSRSRSIVPVPEQSSAVPINVNNSIDSIDNSLATVVILAGQQVSEEVNDQVSNILNLSINAVKSAADQIQNGNLSTESALALLESSNSTLEKSGEVTVGGGTISEESKNSALDNMALVVETLTSKGNLTETQVTQMKSLAITSLVNTVNLLSEATTEEQANNLVASIARVLNAALGTGASLTADVVDQSKILTTKVVNNKLNQLPPSVKGTANLSSLVELQAFVKRPSVLKAVMESSVPVRSKIKSDETANSNKLSESGVSAAAVKRVFDSLSAMISNPNGVELANGTTAASALRNALQQAFGVGNLQLPSEGGLVFLAATQGFDINVDAATGALLVAISGEMYSAVSTNTRLVPDSVTNGVSYLSDGRALAVANGLGVELAPTAYDLLGFAGGVERAGFSISFRADGSVSINVGNGERFTGAFGYDNIAAPAGTAREISCGATSFIEPVGDPATAGYAFGVSCANGVVQRVTPYIDNLGFYSAVLAAGFELSTDRSSGIITIDSVGRFKPSFFTMPLNAADQAYLAANPGNGGMAFRAVDVNADGVIDYQVIYAAGTQMLYGVK